ncbi:Protein transport protein Sec24A [Orchesella cincta]|uniref:Protein transport protein Sec24A n=1 Tax=Orchesella cincta TaxID=48709 RepID=A0A1D2MBX9_ORCCI|nr:Protein transport protein Sec24A [Orchesella cincta]
MPAGNPLFNHHQFAEQNTMMQPPIVPPPQQQPGMYAPPQVPQGGGYQQGGGGAPNTNNPFQNHQQHHQPHIPLVQQPPPPPPAAAPGGITSSSNRYPPNPALQPQNYAQPPPVPGSYLPPQQAPAPQRYVISGQPVNPSNIYPTIPSPGAPLPNNYSNQQQQPPQQYQNLNQAPLPNSHNQNQYVPPQNQQHAYNNGGVGVNQVTGGLNSMSITQQGFNKLWGTDHADLLKTRQVLPPEGVKSPEIRFQHEYMNHVNCSPDLFRCTLTKIPETKTLLQKARLPLGILIHPFKDLTQLPVIQCSQIVRCRSCRTYINPYVYFVDQRRWKCNLCFRVNDLPEEFQYDPVTKTYGDPSRRPEVRSGTIEFLAPADYMVRPPQAAVYLFVLDVTTLAVDTGYLKTVCDVLLEHLDTLPGDARSQIGFITFDSAVHFYNMNSSLSQPQELVVCDIDDIFIPCPDNLLVNLEESKEVVRHLLTNLPGKYLSSQNEPRSALGAALLAAQKILGPIGGRITVFCASLPSVGPGSLPNRQADVKSVKDLTTALNPSTDFYKKLALDCSTQYIAVDLFFLNSQYCDVASISCISKFSGGSIQYFPNYHMVENPIQAKLFEQAMVRYVTRKIGFEAVMRVRCSRGMSIHTFHGNLFVRSTDLLSLPNVNPDAGFGMQVSIDESLSDFQTVCFQAALLYTSSKGERRIRVHTLCLPVAGNVNDVIQSADQQAIIGLLSKMAVDRSLSSNLMDAREAFVNAVVDVLSAYLTTQNSLPNLALVAPKCLQMLPAYTHSILRSMGFRADLRPRLDDRTQFMNQMKTLPLFQLIQTIYPDLYPLHTIASVPLVQVPQSSRSTTPENGEEEEKYPQFPVLHLCSDRIEATGVYLLDQPDLILIYVCRNVSTQFCEDVLGVQGFVALHEMDDLPELETEWANLIRNFISYLQSNKPYQVPIRIIREDSRERMWFVNNLVEDRGEGSVSYYEFLQQLKNMVK